VPALAADTNTPPSSPRIVSIGDRIRPGKYSLHSRFRRAVNLTEGERLVAVVTEEVGKGPVNLVVRGIDLEEVDGLVVEASAARLGGRALSYGPAHIFASRFEPPRREPARLSRNLGRLADTISRGAPSGSLAFLIEPGRERDFVSGFERAYMQRIKEGVGLLFDRPGDWRRGVRRLRGAGYGLTPSGDDFLAGLLVAANLLEAVFGIDLDEVRRVTAADARGGNLLSNTFIELARDNFLFEGFYRLLVSLLEGSEREVAAAGGRLMSLGASSGSDMGVGFLLTMKKGEERWS